jgi:hypothetical protein
MLLDISDEVAVEKKNANKVMTNLRFDDRNQYVKSIDKKLLPLYGLNDTTSEELARFKSPRLEHKIPGEFMIGTRDRETVYNRVFEYIKLRKSEVDIEEIYIFVRGVDEEEGLLSPEQKQKHEQRTGPKEYHWRHDLRNSLHVAKNSGNLINPRKGFWAIPKPYIDNFDKNKTKFLMWDNVLRTAKNMQSQNKDILDQSGEKFASIISIKNEEIRIAELGKSREYAITPSLLWARLLHLNNCNGKQSAETFHSWRALRVSMIALHPRVDWIITGKGKRVKLLYPN